MFSVVVACVLGFLILYANQFLIRRRKREFGTYLVPVSYTHLDVYKRQAQHVGLFDAEAGNLVFAGGCGHGDAGQPEGAQDGSLEMCIRDRCSRCPRTPARSPECRCT